MRAYEFYAKPENGVITIPEEYLYSITDEVKVIVLEQKPMSYTRDRPNVKNKTDLLLPPTMDTRNFKFDREEANAR